MVKTATFATRFISFVDDPHAPAEILLSENQEVVAEDSPSLMNAGGLQRFMYVRGPLSQPVHIVRRERLPDGSMVSVRYEPDLDLICANVTHG